MKGRLFAVVVLLSLAVVVLLSLGWYEGGCETQEKEEEARQRAALMIVAKELEEVDDILAKIIVELEEMRQEVEKLDKLTTRRETGNDTRGTERASPGNR